MGWNALEDIAELLNVRSAQELARLLVLGPMGIRETQPGLAVNAFRACHRDGQPGARDSAMLLATARPWDRCSGRVIVELEATGLLSDPNLASLAEAFVTEDQITFIYPAKWLGTSFVEIDLSLESRKAPRHRIVRRPKGSTGRALRPIQPPLRRWGSARLLRTDPGRTDQIVDLGRHHGGTAGAAVIAGAVDAAGTLADEACDRLVDTALHWPAKSVRLAALRLLAERDGPMAACDRAATDTDASIRGWGERMLLRQRASRSTASAGADGWGEAATGSAASQGTLFPAAPAPI